MLLKNSWVQQTVLVLMRCSAWPCPSFPPPAIQNLEMEAFPFSSVSTYTHKTQATKRFRDSKFIFSGYSGNDGGWVCKRKGSLPDIASTIFINWLFPCFPLWLISGLVMHSAVLILVPEQAQLQLMPPHINSTSWLSCTLYSYPKSDNFYFWIMIGASEKKLIATII